MRIRPRRNPPQRLPLFPRNAYTRSYVNAHTVLHSHSHPNSSPYIYANAHGLSDLDGNTCLHLYSDLDADTHKHANCGPNSDQYANLDSHLDAVALTDVNPYFHLHTLGVPDSD